MIKKSLALAFLITGFLLAGNAYGEEEVYYCAISSINGFSPNTKNDSYEPSTFKAFKFKMKLHRPSNRIELAHESEVLGREIFTCSDASKQLTVMSCVSGVRYFTYNTSNSRFVYSFAHGYVSNNDGSLFISYGKCDKF